MKDDVLYFPATVTICSTGKQYRANAEEHTLYDDLNRPIAKKVMYVIDEALTFDLEESCGMDIEAIEDRADMRCLRKTRVYSGTPRSDRTSLIEI